MKDLNVAVIGIGFLGIQHIEAIRRLPNTKVVAIVGRDLKKTERQANELGVDWAFNSVSDLLNSDLDIDIVHNCTPNGLHYSINKQLIEASIHVFGEKPFTKNATESMELVELAKRHDIKGGINFNYRQNIMVTEMREQVKQRIIGNPWFVHVEYLQDWLLYQEDYNWRMDPEMGGESRAIGDIGSHCFDTIQHILGERIIEVEVKNLRKFDQRFENGQTHNISNEDVSIIFATFESGLKGLIRLSQVTSGKKNEFKISVEGDKQTLEWNQEKPDKLWIGNRDIGNTEIYASEQYLTDTAKGVAILPNGHPVGWHDALTQGIRNFYEDIRTNTNSDYVNFEQAHYIMKIIDACILSDIEGKAAKVN